jgi:hypothetical protein
MRKKKKIFFFLKEIGERENEKERESENEKERKRK